MTVEGSVAPRWRILVGHTRYTIRGGEDESVDAEVELMRRQGHPVALYEDHNDRLLSMPALKQGATTVWSMESYRRIRSTLRSQDVDVVHFQNTFPAISPAAYYAAKQFGLPVVQSLRNYRLLCLNGLLFRDGRPCEDCIGRPVPWPGIAHRCYRDGRAASGTVAAMLVVHRSLRTWTRMVDVYIALTEFAKQKLIEGGIPAEKIIVKPNFVYPDPGVGAGEGRYALFVGRLSREKGVETVLKAWRHLGRHIPLKIVGDGPLADCVAEAAEEIAGVEWLGRQPRNHVAELMGAAHAVIVASQWYEPFGRVIVEAYATGTPVIASDIGALAELVYHKQTGLLVKPGDVEDLAAKVEWAWTHHDEMANMGAAARREYELKYTAERNYDFLMNIYDLAIERGRSGRKA